MVQIDGGLRPLFRTHLTRFGAQFTSIETGGTTRGIPDSEFCLDGISAWVEFKIAYGHQVRLSVEQVGWLSQRHRVGGRCFVAVRVKRSRSKRILACDDLLLFKGANAAQLKEKGWKNVMPLGIWEGGPTNWGWIQIKNLLIE